MAKRRMLSKDTINSAKYQKMTAGTKNFYVYASVNADDEGFLDNVQGHLRFSKHRIKNVEELVDNDFAYYFSENDVLVMRDWLVNNSIRKDKLIPTCCSKEKQMLYVGKDKKYIKLDENDEKTSKNRTSEVVDINEKVCPKDAKKTQKSCPKDVLFAPQDSIGKGSIDKDSIGESSIGESDSVKEVATPEELSALFNLELDVPPTHPLSTYEKALEELNRSSFAKEVIKKLSILHRHLERLLSGEWRDFHKATDVTKNAMPQTYTRKEIDGIVIDPKTFDISAWDP